MGWQRRLTTPQRYLLMASGYMVIALVWLVAGLVETSRLNVVLGLVFLVLSLLMLNEWRRAIAKQRTKSPSV